MEQHGEEEDARTEDERHSIDNFRERERVAVPLSGPSQRTNKGKMWKTASLVKVHV